MSGPATRPLSNKAPLAEPQCLTSRCEAQLLSEQYHGRTDCQHFPLPATTIFSHQYLSGPVRCARGRANGRFGRHRGPLDAELLRFRNKERTGTRRPRATASVQRSGVRTTRPAGPDAAPGRATPALRRVQCNPRSRPPCAAVTRAVPGPGGVAISHMSGSGCTSAAAGTSPATRSRRTPRAPDPNPRGEPRETRRNNPQCNC